MQQAADRVYYPAFLDLADRKCLIVGGGRVAERKCSALVRAGGAVTVISPSLTQRLKGYREKGLIRHLNRNYRASDMKSVFIVIAATDSMETNARVSADAKALHKLVNVVDAPALCGFIVPSTVTRGLLTIAVSTGGASPGLAKAIRKELQELYGPEFSRLLKALKRIRAKAVQEIPEKKARERFLKEITSRILGR